MSEDNNKKQNEPVKKPTEQEANKLSEQDLDKVAGGAGKTDDEETIQKPGTNLL